MSNSLSCRIARFKSKSKKKNNILVAGEIESKEVVLTYYFISCIM